MIYPPALLLSYSSIFTFLRKLFSSPPLLPVPPFHNRLEAVLFSYIPFCPSSLFTILFGDVTTLSLAGAR